MRRKRTYRKSFVMLLLLIVMLSVSFLIYLFLNTRSVNQAENAVESFYLYEQEGAFSEAWDMFHPLMKERFEKGQYLQDRAHVFLNYYDVNTFMFSMEDGELIRNWQIEEDVEPIEEVYRVPVTQYYQSKYGNFSIVQDVFTTNMDGEWKILWDYKKSETSKEPEEN